MIKENSEKREEALLIIELWLESGLSQGAFCKGEGIARSTFQHWRKRYDKSYAYKGKKETSPDKAKESFITVKVDSPIIDSTYDLEVIYKNGVRIKCPSGISLKELQQLISLQA